MTFRQTIQFDTPRETIITGLSPSHNGITNTGTGRIRLVCVNGPDIVIEAGESAQFELRGCRIYRLACNDCGLANGSHHTWCACWRPYAATEE